MTLGPSPSVARDGDEQTDDAEQCAEAAVVDGGLEGAIGQEDDVVGLEDGIGVLALEDALDVQLDDGAAIAFGADEADVAVLAFEEEAAAEGGGLHEGERGVLGEGDGSLLAEGADDVDHADTADDDGIAGEDGDVGELAAEGIGAEVDDDGLGDAGAADGDDVAGCGGKAAGDGEDIEEAARTDDGDDAVDLAGDGGDLVGAFEDLDGDLGVAVDGGLLEAAGDEQLGFGDGEAIELHVADQGEKDAAVAAEAHLGVVVGLLEDADADEVAGREARVVSLGEEYGAVGGEGGGAGGAGAAELGVGGGADEAQAGEQEQEQRAGEER
ncbi:MAG TPA: hypothetical protein VM865_07695 [Acidobacteriaceae bacterium]|nr:hypothetical protein [Acidobacteriaceae bacterium]